MATSSAQVEADPKVDEIILKDTDINLIQIMVETDTITDWSILAILLGISEPEKTRIMKDNPGDAKGQHKAFVKAWLKNGEASWAILASALRHQLVKQKACANEIAKNHPSSSSSMVPSLPDAFKHLKKKSADWDAIGRALDSVSGNDTSNERKGLGKDPSLDNSARLEAFLKIWLQQGGASSTWGQLMEALKEDYYDVVNNIEEFLGLPLSKK